MKKAVSDYIVRMFQSDFRIDSNPTCYFYDLDEISFRVQNILQHKLPNVSLYYAMKANPNKQVIKHIIDICDVKGIEIASIGELEIALEAGLDTTEKVLFTGPAKTPQELLYAVKNKIRFINVESLVEAIRINEIAEKLNIDKVDILVRVNINYFLDGGDEYMAGMSTKLGIDENHFFDDYKVIKTLKHLNICGLHVFAADGVLDYKVLLKYAENVFAFVERVEKKYGKLAIIDFGGGLGIDYTKSGKEFDIQKYFEELKEIVEKFGFESKELIFELGKYIVGTAGYYATRIIDIKDCKGHKHICTAGGVNHMRLPIATDRKHSVYIIHMKEPVLYYGQPEVNNEIVDIEGPLCMTEDKISWDEYIEHASIGDIVVLAQAGAYCYSASTLWFLGHPFPLEICFDSSVEEKETKY